MGRRVPVAVAFGVGIAKILEAAPVENRQVTAATLERVETFVGDVARMIRAVRTEAPDGREAARAAPGRGLLTGCNTTPSTEPQREGAGPRKGVLAVRRPSLLLSFVSFFSLGLRFLPPVLTSAVGGRRQGKRSKGSPPRIRSRDSLRFGVCSPS